MNNITKLEVRNRPLGHYLLSIFSLLFRGWGKKAEEICIGAPSRTIGRTVDMANILCKKFLGHLLKKGTVQIDSIAIPSSCPAVSTIAINLQRKGYTPSSDSQENTELRRTFLEKVEDSAREPQILTICELEFMLSTLIKEGCSFTLSCPDGIEVEIKDNKNKIKRIQGEEIKLGEIVSDPETNDITYRLASSASSLGISIKDYLYLKSCVQSALMRMGLCKDEKFFANFARKVCNDDDVIIAVDTNIFYKAQVTAALLDSFVGVARSDYLDLPNWITLITSAVSMGEIENRANTKKGEEELKGTSDLISTRYHRGACRGLQEFIEIGSCVDLEGVSILEIGDIPPEFDLSKLSNTTRDATIRKQIKEFSNTISFHKGTYFLTMDRICAMFAQAEGLYALYVPRNDIKEEYNLTNLDRTGDIHCVSELVYELGIEFPLKIVCHSRFEGLSFVIKTDWQGKSLMEWENRHLEFQIGADKMAIREIERRLKEAKREKETKEKQLEEAKKKTGQISKKLSNLPNEINEKSAEIKKLENILNESNKWNTVPNDFFQIIKDKAEEVSLEKFLEAWKEINTQRHPI